MIRFLVIVFVSGLIVCAASFAVVVGMGFPKNFNLGHISFENGEAGDKNQPSLGPPGPTATRDIAWDGDEDLTVNIPAVVTYTQGADAKVSITGPKNWIEHIVVEGGDVSLDHGRYSWKGGDRDTTIHIAITAPNVQNFELNGAQDMKILAYNQENFDLQVNGAARVRAAGRAVTVNIEMNGASKAELADLDCDDATVELNGASSVVLAPKVSSDIEINGVGSAKLLTSPPTTHQEIHGFGSVQYGVARSATDNDDGDDKSTAPVPPVPPVPPKAPVAPKAPALPKAKAA